MIFFIGNYLQLRSAMLTNCSLSYFRANIQGKDLFFYKDTKEKFATSGNMKKHNFSDAILQIEAAMNGIDTTPITYEVCTWRSFNQLFIPITEKTLKNALDFILDSDAGRYLSC